MTFADANKLAVAVVVGIGFFVFYWKNHPSREHLRRWASQEGYFLDESRMVGGDRRQTTFRIKVRPKPSGFGVPWIPPPDRNAEDDRWMAPRVGWAKVYNDGRVEVAFRTSD